MGSELNTRIPSVFWENFQYSLLRCVWSNFLVKNSCKLIPNRPSHREGIQLHLVEWDHGTQGHGHFMWKTLFSLCSVRAALNSSVIETMEISGSDKNVYAMLMFWLIATISNEVCTKWFYDLTDESSFLRIAKQLGSSYSYTHYRFTLESGCHCMWSIS